MRIPLLLPGKKVQFSQVCHRPPTFFHHGASKALIYARVPPPIPTHKQSNPSMLYIHMLCTREWIKVVPPSSPSAVWLTQIITLQTPFSPPPPKPQPPRRAKDVGPAPLRDVPLAFPSSGIRPRSSPKAHQFLERGRQNPACDFCRVKNGRRVAYENVPGVSVALQRGFRRPSSSTITRFPRRRARYCSSVRHLAPSWSGLLAQPRQKLFCVTDVESTPRRASRRRKPRRCGTRLSSRAASTTYCAARRRQAGGVSAPCCPSAARGMREGGIGTRCTTR